MQPHTLYQIPFASAPFRIIGGAACLLIVVFLFRWLFRQLPKFLQTTSTRTTGQNLVGLFIYLVPTAFAALALLFLIAFVKNPVTTITDTGIVSQNMFHRQPTSAAWADIRDVYCTVGRDLRVSRLIIRTSDNNRIYLGNSEMGDLRPVYELLQNQLGYDIVHRCTQNMRK